MTISLDTLLYLESGRQGSEPDLIDRLKERAVSARAEGNMTARCDADHFDEAAAIIASQARRIEELENNCRPLVDACYEEMHGTVCDDDPDDEPVASTRDMAGNISHSAITFGMIRRARATLKG